MPASRPTSWRCSMRASIRALPARWKSARTARPQLAADDRSEPASRRQPRRGSHHAPLRQRGARGGAHQLLSDRRRRPGQADHRHQVRQPEARRRAAAASALRDFRLFPAAGGGASALRHRWRAAAFAGPTGRRISAPRCWASSRRSRSRTPSSCRSAPRAASCRSFCPSGPRDAVQAEGTATYKLFMSTLLDITDNLDEAGVIPPPDVVRHDDDDPYLVVAADKGTATFSDIANAIARPAWLLARAMPSRPAARRATTTRRWGSRRAAPGNRSSGISARWTSTSARRRSPWSGSATCRATCSATACCANAPSACWPPSITATSSSTRRPIPTGASPSGRACSRCRARAGRITTRR